MRYYAGYILLEVKLQGLLPMVFIYDTGAEHTIIFEKYITDLLGFNYNSEVQIRGADINTTIVAYISRGISLELLKVPVVQRDIVVLEENFLNLKEMTGVQIDGILGGSFFRNLIMEIDFKRQKLVLWHPDKFKKKLSGFTKHKVEIIDNKPYINCKTQKPNGQEFKLKLLIDTGASLAYLINTNSDIEFTAPEITTPGNLGKGIGGYISGYKGKMKTLQFGDKEFKNILTHFQDTNEEVNSEYYNERNGLIGTSLLQRFTIIIDYLSGHIYLKPNKSVDKEFRYNLSGMELIAFGPTLNNFIVFDVLPGSPAEEAGIEKGDVVKKVGLLKAERYTLNNLDIMLSRRKGKKIKLELIRGTELLNKEFVLRDYLNG